MLIGELAKKLALSTSRIRFYEAQGLLKPGRKLKGYREYPDKAAATLRLIGDAQRLGFTLSEIREGLAKAVSDRPSPGAMRAALKRKLAIIDRHIAEARARRREILRLLKDLEACE